MDAAAVLRWQDGQRFERQLPLARRQCGCLMPLSLTQTHTFIRV